MSGCATTRQLVPHPNSSTFTDTTVCVEISRPFQLGGPVHAFTVQDNGTPIGELGPKGTLRWERPAGAMRLVVSPHILWTDDCILDVHLRGGMHYSFQTSLPFWSSFARNGVRQTALAPLTIRPHEAPAASRDPLPEIHWPPENIAIADLAPYALSQAEAKTLAEKLHSVLVETKYFNILSRSDMKTVLEEQRFQRSDACDDSSCLVEMGKLLAVQKIIGGSIGKVGNTFNLTVRLVNVETGKTEITTDRKLKAEADALLDLIESMGRDLARKYAGTKP